MASNIDAPPTESTPVGAVERQRPLQHGDELDDSFTPLRDSSKFSIAGFGSLLSQRSAKSTFPDLTDFRIRQVKGFRRVFAHTAPIFFERGIARLDTLEISSLSCEEAPDCSIVVAVFDVPNTPEMNAAFLDREHEFRFLAVRPTMIPDATEEASSPTVSSGCASSVHHAADHTESEPLAVICGRWTDAEYKKRRCPPPEFKRRFTDHGVDQVWRDDVLPCRVYLRHCVLAAKGLGPAAEDSFLDATFLSDRRTTVRQYLAQHPEIMEEEPPEIVADRYSG